nr:chromate resistance protein ChrB domain-containing protein [Desulfosarcina ovata]
MKLYPKGETITEGIPFDTPDAKFRRYHNVSTYEMFRRHYQVEDPRCRYISKIVHDIEINTWERKVMQESRPTVDAIQQIIIESSTSDEIIEKGLLFFDRLYGR